MILPPPSLNRSGIVQSIATSARATPHCETSDSQRWLQTMLAWERQQWGGDIGDIWHTAYLFKKISFSMGTVHRSALRSTLFEALLFLDLG